MKILKKNELKTIKKKKKKKKKKNLIYETLNFIYIIYKRKKREIK